MRKIVHSIILLLVMVSSTLATQGMTDKKGLYGEVSFTLDNGLRVIFIEDRRAPIVFNGIVYKVGSVDEKTGRTGMAHMLEHLLFKGNTQEKGETFDAFLESVGGEQNGMTSVYGTHYYQIAPSDSLERLVEWEAQRMRNAVFSKEDLDVEKKIVLQERRKRLESSALSRFWNNSREKAYGKNPYTRSTIGEIEDLKNQKYTELKEFYNTYYQPNNAIVIIAGDASLQEVKELTKKYYGHYKPLKNIQKTMATYYPSKAKSEQFYDKNVSNMTMLKMASFPYATNKEQQEKEILTLQMVLRGLYNKNYAPFYKKYVEKGMLQDFSFSITPMKDSVEALLYANAQGTKDIPLTSINSFIKNTKGAVTQKMIEQERESVRNMLLGINDDSLQNAFSVAYGIMETREHKVYSNAEIQKILSSIDSAYAQKVYDKYILKGAFFTGVLHRTQ